MDLSAAPDLPSACAARTNINDELHAHPYEPLTPPERVVLITMLVTPEQRALEEAVLRTLADTWGLPDIALNDNRTRIDFGSFRLKIEKHQEVTRYKFVWQCTDSQPAEPFAQTLQERLPAGWLRTLPGTLLTALDIAFLPFPEGQLHQDIIDRYAHCFDSRSLACSQVGRSKGLVMTDFRIQPDALVRMLVCSKAQSPAQNGRLLLRLIDLEIYRMLALLALPGARQLLLTLPQSDEKLQQLTTEIAVATQGDDDQLLDHLTRLATDVEQMMTANYRRLSAARAYFDLVAKRVRDLREEEVPGLPSLGGILERRLEPARSTCDSVSRWLDQISLRTSHASELLRTRIDLRREKQNQDLLVAMDKRFQVQVRLQETAEVLSIAVIPYYVVNLLAYIVEELDQVAGWHVEPVSVKAIAAPLIALAIFMGLQVMRRSKKHG